MFGMERSGTTLMSMMMGAHPQIAVPLATTGMWFDFFERFSRDYQGAQSPEDLDRLVRDVMAHERIRLWRTPMNRERLLAKVELGDFGSVVTAFHEEYARQLGKPYWGNIDIATLDNMHLAHRWFPDARFLHIVRDGRDVALSNQTMPYGPGNIAECAEAWRKRLGINLRMGDILGPERYFVVCYESLVIDPAATLQGICDFLKIGFSEEMLSYAATVDARVPQEKLWLWPELKSPPQASKVDRWRREMSDSQRTVFEWIAGPLLRDLGYEAREQPPKRFGPYLLELFYFLDRGGRTKRLLRKLGIHRSSKLEREAEKREEGK